MKNIGPNVNRRIFSYQQPSQGYGDNQRLDELQPKEKGAEVTTGKPLSSLSGRTLDYIEDSGSRFAAIHNSATQDGIANPVVNLFPNPSGALGTTGWGFIGAPSGFQSLNASDGWQYRFNMPASTATAGVYFPLTVTAGATVTLSADVYFGGLASGDFAFDATGDGFDAGGYVSSTGQDWHRASWTFTLPAGVGGMNIRFFVSSASGSGLVAFRRIKVELGSVATPFDDFASQFGNQLTVAGSGVQIGDGLNLIALNTGGYATAYWTGSAVTVGATSISATAGTWHAGSVTRSYNSWSVSGLANSTTYYFGLSDPTYAGGSPSVVYSTDPKNVSNADGVIFAFKATTTSSDGTGGGGGYGSCIALTMWLRPGLRASRAHEHTVVDCADDYKLIGRRRVHAMHHYTEPCERLVADNGAALICSSTTPFTLPDGSSKLAPDMLGEKVLTDRGEATIIEVTHAGTLPVARISVGGLSYAAGEDPANRIYSHNTYKP